MMTIASGKSAPGDASAVFSHIDEREGRACRTSRQPDRCSPDFWDDTGCMPSSVSEAALPTCAIVIARYDLGAARLLDDAQDGYPSSLEEDAGASPVKSEACHGASLAEMLDSISRSSRGSTGAYDDSSDADSFHPSR